MTRLKIKTLVRLLPLYIILGIALIGIGEQLLYENITYDDRVIDIVSIVICSFILVIVSIKIFGGMGQKQVYALIGKEKLGTNQARAYEILDYFLDTSDKIHGINYDEKFILGWNGWYTTMIVRSEIVSVVIKKKVYRYKILIPVMAEYSLVFYLNDGTTQYMSVRKKKDAMEICETLDIQNVKYDDGWKE